MTIKLQKTILTLLIILIVSLSGARMSEAAFNDNIWVERAGSYVELVWSSGRNILVRGVNKYLNFGTISGSSGYGFRDNAGTIEYKNSGGAWAGVGSGSGSGASSTIVEVDGVQVNSGVPTLDFDGGDFILGESPTDSFDITIASSTYWSMAYAWGNHANAGYLSSYTETDPLWQASSSNYYTKTEADLADDNTTYTAGGTLLDLTGTTFSLNEGTLTNGKICTYVTGTGIVCDYTDQVGSGGGATTTINGVDGPAFTFSTSSDTNLGLSISPSLQWQLSWLGTLASDRIASSSEWSTAYGWGDHSTQGYLTSYSTSTPGGVEGSIQYNSGGFFGGSGNLLWNNSTRTLTFGAANQTATFRAPDAIVFGNQAGGSFVMEAGTASGTAAGGNMTVQSGNADLVGDGGTLAFYAGQGGATSGAGGSVELFAGGATSGDGGGIFIGAGAGADGGVDGQIYFYDPTSGNDAHLDMSLLSGSYQFSFPDKAGTFALLDDISSSTFWDEAYSWGNHADEGYLTSYTETDPVWMAASSSYYLASNPSNYIALTHLSSTASGLEYNNGTGVFSLTTGYVIPLSASTTAWATFYDTPSTRITAGDYIDWSGNTLNVTDSWYNSASDVIGGFSGCSGTQYLGADGACHTDQTGSASAAGSTTHIQYNNGGVLAGSSNLTWNDASKEMYVGGDVYFSAPAGGGFYSETGEGIGYIYLNGIGSLQLQGSTTSFFSYDKKYNFTGGVPGSGTGYSVNLDMTGITSARNLVLPNKSGTFALLDDLATSTWNAKADYSFGANNFLGTGNFVTSGLVNATSSRTTNATTTNLAFTGITNSFLAVDPYGLVIATTTPAGSGTNYLSLGDGHIYTSTSTDYFKSNYFVATSTSATSTFAGNVTIDGNLRVTGNLEAEDSLGALLIALIAAAMASYTLVFTNKRIQPRTASSTTSASLTPDLSTANVYYRTTQTEALTINAPTGTPVIGEVVVIHVDSASAQTLTINATYKAFGSAFPATTTAGKTFLMTAQYNGTDWKTMWSNAV